MHRMTVSKMDNVTIKLPKKAGLLFLGLWLVNGLSHDVFPIKIGDIYHHWCKDNSITNMALTVIAFYMFKELKIQSKFINKAATCVFAVFALNGSAVRLVMEYVQKSTSKRSRNLSNSFWLKWSMNFCI